ncbi:nascent polypeptide-associated complex subunit alpha, muscle-specific form-like isoform X2 [Salvelinus fontinalis]|uniref:nascent polypeptide-associated complex subunit alpha, muscle-specific form-like isoform X2 n=1 Tax=Salvelinus fontinalis TaxID=8038 RepID=UPI002485DD01|nr:nascent polypeptide-associated complex subunit alpha, muscle-specific form-like isoform X2 [Salvelinus fontinalis]
MASVCKRQQCSIERRGFRQDLDSWRHKLIHCVGFESILEGLFGSGLLEDLTLFKGSEPEGVTDWSFDENCLFCCLKRDKVKEHLVGLSDPGLESGAKPLLLKDQTKINRLEKQAEEFFNAVLYKEDVPSFSDPHIPVVALEIMQRMIRQFAAEYTSKSSSSTPDSRSTPRPGPHPDQSLPPPPSLPTVPPAASTGGTATASVPSQNPVLSKLLMADQDLPLDLTVKKPLPQPVEQDGVLDLSLKKGRAKSSTSSLRSPHLSQTSTLRGECLELTTENARDLQSTSTLEEFMTKLCLHHQRQIVDALGFLHTEVKAISSSSTSLAPASKPSCSVEHGALQGPSAAPCLQSPERGRTGQKLPLASTPKGSTEGKESLVTPEQTAVFRNVSGAAGPALDLRQPGPGESKALATLFRSADDSVSKRLSDHAPLKIKILKSSSLADGKKLSCVLTTSLPAGAGTLEEMQGISDSSTRADTYSAGQGSSVKRHDHADRSTRQRGSIEHTKDTLVKQSPPEKIPNNIPPVSPGTARKTIKGSSYHRPRDTSSVCRFVTDPDLGHCDIVYIDKPITECFRDRQHRLLPRRNARKSTRGHMYVEEMWELKTVRTLAKTSARNDSGNCPTPMPELITLVTPKQVIGKPEGVPLVDMPFVGGFVETVSQKTPSELPAESEVAGDVEAAAASASGMALNVETSQTDQSQCKEQTAPPPPPQSPPVDNEQSTGTNSEQPRRSIAPEDNLAQTVVETADQGVNSKHNYIVLSENPEQVVMGKDVNLSQDKTSDEAELVQDMLQSVPKGQKVVSETQQESASLTPSLESNEDKEVVSAGAVDKEQAMPLEPQISVDQKPSEGSGGEAKAGMEVPVESERIEVQETGEVEPDLAPGDGDNVPEEKKTHVDPSSKKVSKAVEKELPLRHSEKQGIPARVIPSRVKEAAVIDTESMIICGYVNGRPIGHSDRCLRERPARTTPESTPTKTKRPTKASLKQTENPSENASEIPQVSHETALTPIPAGESVKSPSSKRLTKASLKQCEKYSENMPEVPQVSLPSAEVIKSPVSIRPKRTPKAKINQNLPDTQTPAEASQIMSDTRTPISPIAASQSIPDTPQVPDTPVNSSRSPESRQPLRSARLQQAAAVASPLAPVASPLAPVASPLAPVASPLAPVASPLAPVASPLAPVASPLAPVASPLAPVASPLAPVASPLVPVASPVASPLVPVASPLVPVASHLDPVASPLVPVASPLVPVASPLVPVASPLVPVASPLVPVASPLVPVASPLVPVASPLVPVASPLVPVASPLVPVASPLVPVASPLVPVASPLVPVASPLVPVASPLVPVASPLVPVASPLVPVASPLVPVASPLVPVASPLVPVASPLVPVASPLVPVASPLVPVASPLVPVASPLVPVASPLVPVASPLVPVASPLVPVASPLVPVASPLVPVASPLVPVASPLVPVASPLVPVASPLVPVASPLVPVASPLVPVASPLVPVASPLVPVASPLVPVASPLVPVASPLVPVASPLVPVASPLVPVASPLVPVASPLVPVASPLVPVASPLVPVASPLVPVASPPVPVASPPVPVASPPVPVASPPVRVASPPVPDASPLVPDASPSVEGAVIFIVAPEPSTSLPLPSTELNPPLPIASPLLPIVSHLFPSSHQNSAVTQSSAELKVQKAQPAPNSKPSETEKTAEETRGQTRPKLRSSMMVAKEVEIVENQQVSSEDSALTEGTRIKKSEAHTQSSPLRSKRTLKKEGESSKLTLLKKAAAPTSMDNKTSSEDSSRSSVSSTSDKPGRMPLRSESSKTDVASQSITPATPPTPVENRKSALRVQRSPIPSTSAPITAEKWSEVASPIRLKSPVRLPSPIRFKPERIIKSPLRESPLLVSSPLPSSSVTPFLLPKLELPVQTRHKFLELLDVEENQQKISSLNTMFDKMQRGWVQMDKEGHPTPRHKNKADRQAAIWKSKRRVRKPKSSDHQRYSLVQMLFKNDLDLASICHWYMESTETQSLVIVKKVNTRLPSETQLLFPGMSQRPSQGVFPSLQAERLKKHLKKFAMASPVKSNPKSQKLIAKALEQEVSTSMPKGKEKRELTTATRISTKAYVSSAEAQAQPADGQKASAKAKNPASARILRKYSNIREKMQGQQSSKNPKGAPRKELEASKVKPSKPPKKKLAKPSKLKPAIAQRQKLSVSGDKGVKETSVVKTERAQPSPSRKSPVKAAVLERSVKTSGSSRTLRDLGRKESASPQRSPQRVMTPKAQKNTPAPATVPKTDFNKQQVGAEKAGVDKTMATKAGQTKRPSQSRVFETKVTESKGTESNGAESAAETPQQNMDVKTPGSPDQVLTRSQRKMEADPPPSIPQSASPKPATKKANEPAQSGTPKSATKRALEPTHTVSTSPKSAIKRASEPAQSGAPKGATKRSQESPQTPAKRTRTSLQK